VWALPIAFGVGVGAGSLVTQVAMVAEDPLDSAQQLPDIKDEVARIIPATQAAWVQDASIEAEPAPLRPAVGLSVSESVQAPPKRALLLAATATRRLGIDEPNSDAQQPQKAPMTGASLRDVDPLAVEQVTVGRGDTLSNILDRAQIDTAQAHAVVQSLRGVYDPRRLKVGQELLITAAAAQEGVASRQLMSLALDLDFDHRLQVTRGPDGQY
jgi:hypothetical protein